ncbi:MAG: hypothetical protein MUE94_05135 [Verrucomicrobia bacterium]|jgi:hypothetical protein|nr:hypothetical protein [Verrucomicrobiota bacterium]
MNNHWITNQAIRARWLDEAERLKPALHSEAVSPVHEARFVDDAAAFQGWRAAAGCSLVDLASRELSEGDSVDLDFGTHLVGSLEISLEAATRGVDAPVRLHVLLGEMPIEIAAPREPFHSNMLARTWLQEETVHLDDVPGTVALARRFAFRFVRISVTGLSRQHRVRIASVIARTSGAVIEPVAPPAGLTHKLAAIDAVAVRTLRNCLHTVFEDGPKRDRRLWLGDLRLQALANAVTFRRFDVVKRCLLLFAGLARPDGLVEACVFEKPQPLPSNNLMADYALLFVPTLLDYAVESGDWETGRELWPVARHQVATITGALDAAGKLPAGDPFGWTFMDWQPKLHREGAFLGLAIYVLREAAKLAAKVEDDEALSGFTARAETLSRIAHEQWRDAAGNFISGPQAQRSLATTAWMILAGVVQDAEARAVLHPALNDPAYLQPAGPYLWHHVVHAFHLAGDRATGLHLMEQYWGKMLDLGADTFWEVFNPADHFASPYENAQLNSYCHAWSCTPSWFLRHPQFK